MHIICASYNNIGPFANQTITLFLKNGKYLIKAPIGSGKSFLFFDGLVYALYGYSKRDMLNVSCDSGWTKVLFTNDDKEVFLVERPLTGKKGVKLRKIATTLEMVTQDLEKYFTQVLTYGQDFAERIDVNMMESFDFHRSVEVQQSIELLLPPRAVFLQRHILMQDSDNIFDLQPKARIDILKLLFGLDMIDTVRDKIGEQKNELRGQYKVLTESAHITESYQSWFDSFSGVVTSIQSVLALCDDQTLQTEFDNIGLTQFLQDPLASNVDSLKYDVHERSLTGRTGIIDRLTKESTQLESEVRFLQEQQTTQESTIVAKKQRLTQLQQTIETYRKELNRDGSQGDLLLDQDAQSMIEQLVAQKQSIVQDIALLDQSIQPSHWSLLQSYDLSPIRKTVPEYSHMLDKLKQLGISKKHELDTVQAKIQTHQLQQANRGQELLAAQKQLALLKQKEYEQFVQSQEHAIGLLQKTVDEGERQQNSLQEQLQTTQKTLDGLLVQSQHLSQFHCDRIDADCPFISQINAGSLSKLDMQIQQTKEHIEAIQHKMEQSRAQLKPQQQELMQLYNTKGAIHFDTFQPQHPEYTKILNLIHDLELGDHTSGDQLQTATLEQQQKRLQEQIATIRSDYVLLNDIVSPADRDRYEQLVASGKQLEADILLTQQRIQQQQSKRQEYHTLLAQCDQLTAELVVDQNAHNEQNKLLLSKKESLSKSTYVQLPKLSQYTKTLEQLVHKSQDLYLEKKRVEEKTIFVKQQLDIASDLHSIFSKELTLYVLQSYIPVLNDYINAFLAKVVDIQLSIQIGPDGDELILTIEDDRGIREVKSLSGGQKTVLRLCWILATSVVFGNSFLLLDETINNIDSDIVGKVSELLSDYVKQHNITFYVVTHSEQIQHMTMWDGTISLS